HGDEDLGQPGLDAMLSSWFGVDLLGGAGGSLEGMIRALSGAQGAPVTGQGALPADPAAALQGVIDALQGLRQPAPPAAP
ncbi:MAG: hypothetical protein OEY14_06045, partial [Myxococcales bacterium]|nr:hypothetical protein [Myxococcales bacterium]